jgi:hypothetical protein
MHPLVRKTRTADSACASELARCVTGKRVAIHAGFANVNALNEVSCIEILMSLGDAMTLLTGVLRFLPTRSKAGRTSHQHNETSQLHSAFSGGSRPSSAD